MATFLCLNERFYDGSFSWGYAVEVDMPSPLDFAKAAEQALATFDMGDGPIDTILLVKQAASGEIKRFRVEVRVDTRYLAFQDNTIQPPREDINAPV